MGDGLHTHLSPLGRVCPAADGAFAQRGIGARKRVGREGGPVECLDAGPAARTRVAGDRICKGAFWRGHRSRRRGCFATGGLFGVREAAGVAERLGTVGALHTVSGRICAGRTDLSPCGRIGPIAAPARVLVVGGIPGACLAMVKQTVSTHSGQYILLTRLALRSSWRGGSSSTWSQRRLSSLTKAASVAGT